MNWLSGGRGERAAPLPAVPRSAAVRLAARRTLRGGGARAQGARRAARRVAMDYTDFHAFAASYGYNEAALLTALRGAGLTSLAVAEELGSDVNDDASAIAISGQQLIDQAGSHRSPIRRWRRSPRGRPLASQHLPRRRGCARAGALSRGLRDAPGAARRPHAAGRAPGDPRDPLADRLLQRAGIRLALAAARAHAPAAPLLDSAHPER